MTKQSEDSPGLSEIEKKQEGSLAWLPWYPKDWLTSDSVGRMNDGQIVAYIMLLNRQWLCIDGRLPEDLSVLSKYSGHDMTTKGMKIVLDRFPVHPEGGRANRRLYDIYLKQQDRHNKRVESAHKRWKLNAKQHAMHEHCESDSDSISISISTLKGDSKGGYSQEWNQLFDWLNKTYQRIDLIEHWNYDEQYLLCQTSKRPHILSEIKELTDFWERAMKAPPQPGLRPAKAFLPQNVLSCLRKWNETLDRARNTRPKEIVYGGMKQ